MRKILIFGNSSSGKSTLAKELAATQSLPHLDLDTLAWLPVQQPVRAPLDESNKKIQAFVTANQGWVIEGGYTDLLDLLRSKASEIIFMNLETSHCVRNAKNRPWEPHKYESKAAQDKNLNMLIDWIKQYARREDAFSFKAHMNFYKNFPGKKTMHTNNERNA